MKNIYDSCIDGELVNSRGKEPLIEFLNEFNITSYKENFRNGGFTDLLVNLHHYSIYSLFNVNYKIIDGKQNQFAPILAESSTVLNKEKYNNETLVNYYKEYITTTLTSIFDNDEKDVEAMTESIINIEKKLANILKTK